MTVRPDRTTVGEPELIPATMVPAAIEIALDAAIGRFLASPRFACAHVGRGQPALLCGQHAVVGVSCPACFRRHLQRHDDTTEHQCDACSEVGPSIIGLSLPLRGVVQVRNPSGRMGLLCGTVLLGGFGLCRTCRPVVAA